MRKQCVSFSFFGPFSGATAFWPFFSLLLSAIVELPPSAAVTTLPLSFLFSFPLSTFSPGFALGAALHAPAVAPFLAFGFVLAGREVVAELLALLVTGPAGVAPTGV